KPAQLLYEGWSRRARAPGVGSVSGLGQKTLGEGRSRQRAAEQVALHLVTAVFTQEGQLRVGFDAFGDHREVQAMGHGDDCAGDLAILFAGRQAVDEAAVDL